MMAGKENSAMTILMDFAKPCKGKLIGSVVLALLGALCGMIPYIGFLVSIAFIVLMFLPGTPGPNRFGPDPKGAGEAETFA